MIEQSNRTADGPAVFYYFVDFIDYYNYNKTTVGLFVICFEEISVESPINYQDREWTAVPLNLRSKATEDLHLIYYKVIQQ